MTWLHLQGEFSDRSFIMEDARMLCTVSRERNLQHLAPRALLSGPDPQISRDVSWSYLTLPPRYQLLHRPHFSWTNLVSPSLLLQMCTPALTEEALRLHQPLEKKSRGELLAVRSSPPALPESTQSPFQSAERRVSVHYSEHVLSPSLPVWRQLRRQGL